MLFFKKFKKNKTCECSQKVSVETLHVKFASGRKTPAGGNPFELLYDKAFVYVWGGGENVKIKHLVCV